MKFPGHNLQPITCGVLLPVYPLQTLWKGKAYIPQSFREDSNHLRAYGASIKDARRTFITEVGSRYR
jgi:hypothetical protein